MVDRVIEYNPGVSAVAIKNVTINDNFFPGHFPDRPIMPGVLMVEVIAFSLYGKIAQLILGFHFLHKSPIFVEIKILTFEIGFSSKFSFVNATCQD